MTPESPDRIEHGRLGGLDATEQHDQRIGRDLAVRPRVVRHPCQVMKQSSLTGRLGPGRGGPGHDVLPGPLRGRWLVLADLRRNSPGRRQTPRTTLVSRGARSGGRPNTDMTAWVARGCRNHASQVEGLAAIEGAQQLVQPSLDDGCHSVPRRPEREKGAGRRDGTGDVPRHPWSTCADQRGPGWSSAASPW